jgi:hypothetical protein
MLECTQFIGSPRLKAEQSGATDEIYNLNDCRSHEAAGLKAIVRGWIRVSAHDLPRVLVRLSVGLLLCAAFSISSVLLWVLLSIWQVFGN